MFFKKDTATELRDQIADLEAKNSELCKTIEDQRQTISSFVGVKTDFEKQISAVEKKYQAEILKLTEQLEQEKNSVCKKVNQALGNIGVTMFAPEELGSGPGTPQDIYQRFLSLKGEEKAVYFKAHERVISKYIGLSQ